MGALRLRQNLLGESTAGTNTRLRWSFSPLGDPFVVYNYNANDGGLGWALDSSQLLLKVAYAFRY